MKWIWHLMRSFGYSLQGIRTCFRDEMAFRQECVLAIPHFLGVFLLPISIGIRLYLIALWFLLMAVELLNTAIESVTNLASPQFDKLAAKAKDCASAAVFCVILLLIGSWAIVVWKLVVANAGWYFNHG